MGVDKGNINIDHINPRILPWPYTAEATGASMARAASTYEPAYNPAYLHQKGILHQHQPLIDIWHYRMERKLVDPRTRYICYIQQADLNVVHHQRNSA